MRDRARGTKRGLGICVPPKGDQQNPASGDGAIHSAAQVNARVAKSPSPACVLRRVSARATRAWEKRTELWSGRAHPPERAFPYLPDAEVGWDRPGSPPAAAEFPRRKTL